MISVSAGIPRYHAPYPTMVRAGFPPRPPGAPIGIIPPLSRPPIHGIRGIPSIIPPVVRPAVPIVAPTEKPQTTVYVGKIASTVENEFLESLLRLCGQVKSWKRAENPSDGTFRGFGFCEFESAEGVLRALRLLNKLNIDGQELVLNVNQATREYLERYVDKKTEREKLKESEAKASEKENESPSGTEKQEPPTSAVNSEEHGGESGDKEKQESAQRFGIVTDEDRDADKDSLEKLTNMMRERLKNKPLPPPPSIGTASDPAKPNSEVPSKSRDGDSDVDIMKNDAAEDRKDEEMSESKLTADHDRSETSSSDRARRRERSRERDRERDLKRGKERELERYERDRERDRVRREREREIKIREAERLYKDHVKEWEARERERENHRQREIEREKERARERRREIKDQENESDDDDTRKRRHRSSVLEERRRKRQREKEDDLADRLREEEEIAEAKKRAIEEHKQKEESYFSDQVNGDTSALVPEEEVPAEDKVCPVEQPYESDSLHGNNVGDGIFRNGNGNEIHTDLVTASDVKQGNNVSSRKLGFGLMASGKRTTVPSVFHEEDDEDMEKEKKMRPLVPIDYSTEELQAVQATASGTPPNLVAAAEFAKRISSVNAKEDKHDLEKERYKRSNDRSSQRDRNREDEEHTRTRDDNKEKSHDKVHRRDQEDKLKTTENKKLLDAKQLIDMIPKTKEKLFAYEINWDIYDKHELHERMRPWISKKITEFLGEEEATLVDYIVSSTREHVHASQMLELLQSILDDEAEMFVLKMWRMLIFEIKKVETGLNLKSKA
uniref:RNA-binding protein 25 n=1 Tax=Anthurium amnicola TaxID=1678845 RepID=A0A1D1ZAQ2_9ARAE